MDKEILYNRAKGLIKVYENSYMWTNLEAAMCECLREYIKLYEEETEQVDKLGYVINLCEEKLKRGD